jgi:hypothetical protein
MRKFSEFKALAEVLRIKVIEPPQLPVNPLVSSKLNDPVKLIKHYYVHYIDYNKRLDEWVTIDRMNVEKIQAPNTSSSAANNAANAAAAAAKAANAATPSSTSLAHLTSVTNSPMHQSISKKELASLALSTPKGSSNAVDQNGDSDSNNRQRKRRKLSPPPSIAKSKSQVSVQSPALTPSADSVKDEKLAINDQQKEENESKSDMLVQ